jgi:hypothetical protein
MEPPLPVQAILESLGKGFAEDFLAQLKKPDAKRTDAEIANAARQRLADLIPRMRI